MPLIDGWDSTPRPWRRFFARLLDIQIGLVLAIIAGVLGAFLGGSLGLVDELSILLAFACFVWTAIGFQALCIGVLGRTVGKSLWGIRITRHDGRPIGFIAALLRELVVVSVGLGLAIPVVMHVAMIMSYLKLKREGATRWDQAKPWNVTYRPFGVLQAVLGAIAIVLLLSFVVLLHVATLAFDMM